MSVKDEPTIAESVIEFFAQDLAHEIEKITPESRLKDLGADSLNMVEFQNQLEDQFDLVKIPDEVWEKVRTVGDAIKAVEEALAQQNK